MGGGDPAAIPIGLLVGSDVVGPSAFSGGHLAQTSAGQMKIACALGWDAEAAPEEGASARTGEVATSYRPPWPLHRRSVITLEMLHTHDVANILV